MIRNLKFKIQNSTDGFTLIELLAVMIIMIAIGLVVAVILVSSLRGSSKTTVINELRQSGSYPINQMSKMIGFAKSFNGVSVDGTDGTYITDCTEASVGQNTPTPVPQDYNYVKITLFDDSNIIFSCQGSSPDITIASNGASLINTDQISVDSCSFSCTQSYITQSPVIGIHFSLSKKTSSTFAEQSFSIPFDTTVSIRNLAN